MDNFSRVIWITGLSGSGKTTIANEVVSRLRSSGQAVVMLDGDLMREVFGVGAATDKNHGREGRLALAKQYANLCRVIAAQGFIVVIATISMFREVHIWNRSNLPGYFEMYLKVPLEELRRRDPKGIYSRYDAGELNCVAGLDLQVDEPNEAEWIVEFEPERSVESIAKELINRLNERQEI
ncbi:MAG: adenylyl-sulfate kinase [Verrucomicrobiales bacterium]|nr:adenylyl-sulfate kinase [Verrucomicrobiales bacterium]